MKQTNENIRDNYAPSNGVRERYTLVGLIVGILSVGGALYFILETVNSAALVLIMLLVGGAIFITYRVTRAVTRDHDAEVVQAGMQGMQTALNIIREQYSQREIPAPPQGQMRIAPPKDMWVATDAHNLTRMDARDLPVDHSDDAVLIDMGGDETESIPRAKVEAFIARYPTITQDTFTKNGGGSPVDYGRFAEMLCDCDPPLLLRKPDGRGGYTFAAQHWGGVSGWLSAHNIAVR